MSINKKFVDKFINVSSKAALSSFYLVGKKDKISADKAAVDSMRIELNKMDIEGKIVIGEGELDEAPMLYIGENVGKGGPKIDIALDPLEGTTITAKGGQNALAVMAFATHGGFLNAPDVYMDKIAVGGGLPEGVVDLDAERARLDKEIQKVGKDVQDLERRLGNAGFVAKAPEHVVNGFREKLAAAQVKLEQLRQARGELS